MKKKKDIETKQDIKEQLDKCKHKSLDSLKNACVTITMIFYVMVVFFPIFNMESKDRGIIHKMFGLLGASDRMINLIKHGGLIAIIAIVLIISIKAFISFFNLYKDTAVEGVLVTDKQFKTLNDACEEYCKLLGLENKYNVYVTLSKNKSGIFNFDIEQNDVIKVSGYFTGTDDIARFALARELAKRYYNQIGVKNLLLTFCGRLIPILSHNYSKALEYSYDKAACVITNDSDPVSKIATLVVNYQLARQMDKEEYNSNAGKSHNKYEDMVWRSVNRMSYVPIGQYRIKAVRNMDEDGILF